MILAVKFLLLVVLLILLLRWKVDLSLAVFLVSLLTIALFAINLKLAVRSAWQGISARETLELFLIIVLVQYIGAVQKSRRMYDRLVDALNTMIRDKRLVAMVSPAIIGFLPMPGGALLSAPLVDVSTAKMKLKPAFNAFLNFWFRHDWELIWPLYAGLLLFQTMSRIPMRRIILFQLPFSILHIVCGLAVSFWYFRRHGIQARNIPVRATASMPRCAISFPAPGRSWPSSCCSSSRCRRCCRCRCTGRCCWSRCC